MIFKWGSYAHDIDEVMVRTSQHAIMDKFNRRMGAFVETTIVGAKQVTDNANPDVTKASLTTALTAMEAAYDEDYQDFGLYLDDGVTPTVHHVLNADTFGGTKVVVPPSYMNGPWTGRIEYLNRRMFFIVIRHEIRVGTGLYQYNERITIRGTGGDLWKYSPQQIGPPQRQGLQTLTSFLYIQEGDNIGREDWQPPSDPLFPLIEHGEMRIRAFEAPKDQVHGSDPEMFGTSWRYVMEADVSVGFSAFILPTVGP
jgi:hypothetical protein